MGREYYTRTYIYTAYTVVLAVIHVGSFRLLLFILLLLLYGPLRTAQQQQQRVAAATLSIRS